jgi:ubiquinone/menaquinone biosynthesis C-methylase UbiE
MIYWLIGIVVVGIGFYLLDREIYFYEATHLGPRVQGWLYDRWAAKYDLGKKESIVRDADMLAKPVLEALTGIPSPLILDLATGTGRFPLALLKETGFTGQLVAVDVSAGMLEQAAAKLAAYPGRVTYLRWLEFPLPFADNSFDVVSCLEALEVMPEAEAPLAELYRILRPGGLLISSRATDASGRKSKIRSVEQFTQLVQGKGFEQVEIVRWWRWFDRVLARKPGQASPSGFHAIDEVLVCPQCAAHGLHGLTCGKCGYKLSLNEKGVLLG